MIKFYLDYGILIAFLLVVLVFVAINLFFGKEGKSSIAVKKFFCITLSILGILTGISLVFSLFCGSYIAFWGLSACFLAVFLLSRLVHDYLFGTKKMIHELKILPVYFEEVISGRKQFEVRKNDRNFQLGDQLILKEWNKEGFTGRSYHSEITYITDYMQKEGYVVLGIREKVGIVK